MDRKKLQLLHFMAVTDGIDQCHVGFLPCHFVPQAPSFDGVLVQVTEVYSPTSESMSKQKKFCHNMGCCLVTLITELPAWAVQANKSKSAFLTKLRKKNVMMRMMMMMMMIIQPDELGAVGFVGYDDKDCAPITAIATATATCPFAKQRRTKHAAAASLKECITPTAIVNKVAAKKKARSRDSTPSRRSNRVLDQDKKSQSTKMKPQVLDLRTSLSPKKKPPDGKLNQKVMAAPPAAGAATTVARKENDRKEIHCCRQQKDVAILGQTTYATSMCTP